MARTSFEVESEKVKEVLVIVVMASRNYDDAEMKKQKSIIVRRHFNGQRSQESTFTNC